MDWVLWCLRATCSSVVPCGVCIMPDIQSITLTHTGTTQALYCSCVDRILLMYCVYWICVMNYVGPWKVLCFWMGVLCDSGVFCIPACVGCAFGTQFL